MSFDILINLKVDSSHADLLSVKMQLVSSNLPLPHNQASQILVLDWRLLLEQMLQSVKRLAQARRYNSYKVWAFSPEVGGGQVYVVW